MIKECQPFFGDTIIIAIGQSTDLTGIKEQGIAISRPGGLEADPVTLQTPIDWVFAGGDAYYGPKSVVDAVACGKEAAESIHRFINGLDLTEGREKEWDFVKPDVSEEANKPRTTVRCLDPEARECNFLEVSFGFNEEEAKTEADRCLKCGRLLRVLPMRGRLPGRGGQPRHGGRRENHQCGGHHPGARFYSLRPHQPSDLFLCQPPQRGHQLGDGAHPFRIGSLRRAPGEAVGPQGAGQNCLVPVCGSRDINCSDHSYCSSVCCMYTNKQTVIAKEHSEKELDTAVFFMDMRTHGKEFEKYYMRTRDERGVRFIRSKVHTIDPVEDDNLRCAISPKKVNKLRNFRHDRPGRRPGAQQGVRRSGENGGHRSQPTSACRHQNLEPVSSSRPGRLCLRRFQEPKDIPQSVMEASAAASTATSPLAEARGTLIKTKELPPEIDVSEQEPRIGVFVCNCGINIGGIADVPAVREYAATLPNVVHVEDNLFTCSQDTQDKMKEVIKEHDINRVIVASCSPRTHEPLFQETIRDAGLNKYLFEMANIRDQNTWVHMNDPERATAKAKDLVRMAVAKAAHIEPLHQVRLEVIQKVLVVGGGVAGMEAALGVAKQGIQVYPGGTEQRTGRRGPQPAGDLAGRTGEAVS
jgi:heterodisulfide reductase subunit A-like polyferredoxin